ncbi:MAG: NADPH-dependent FMN reductase [Candidatus Marinimicrobia bacterium]|nr:NADPH-dependent FMN reductase [Candidatus Neomarinimicrobiota bacterium]
MQSQNIRVVGLNGSLREGSFSRKAVQIALNGAAELGAAAQMLDLRNYDLPFCSGTRNVDSQHPDVRSLRSEVKAADGLILGTPEYHGSFSGVLKNTLDLMGFEEFEGKMLGLVSVSGGRMGGLDALNSLRAIGRTLHAWVIPDQVSIPEVYDAFEKDGSLKDAKLQARVVDVGRQVARFSYLHTAKQTNEFLKEWEEAPPNPGAKNR